ncbi:unnamed protein product [Leptidea sinapis]|uniref:Uncharacterized protein n=1 Tax=Leptidea sinapis TaxID=189913 RepID=A0A5E4PRB6_9NEOP|nr:unnamed protein product [Leptidea sinapis]
MNTILKLNYLTVPDNIRRGRCELYLQYLYKTPLHFGLSKAIKTKLCALYLQGKDLSEMISQVVLRGINYSG